MIPPNTQLRLEDVSDEYKAFVDKFKTKKTTDDCYTPENIYNVVRDWACREYGIDPADIVRPFWPGGDYERFPYTEKSVVVDNPPFSIVTKICRFYLAHEIPFFLFAPYLTNFSASDRGVSHIISPESIIYENGAEINTSFLTNLDKWFIRSCPDLAAAIREENRKNLAAKKKQVPKYSYPDNVLAATDVGYMCNHGIEFHLAVGDCFFIRELDAQKPMGKTLFGGGFLLSNQAAAERAAREKEDCITWELSEREKRIIEFLSDKQKAAT